MSIMLNPNNVEKTPNGLLASVYRKLISKPLIKGKNTSILDSIVYRLRNIDDLKKEYKRYGISLPDTATIMGWAYDNALTQKSFFTLTTILMGSDKVDIQFTLTHDQRMMDILGCDKVTTHIVTYVNNIDDLVIRRKDNITRIRDTIISDLKINLHMDKITKLVDDTGYHKYKNKLTRYMLVTIVSWSVLINFITLMLFVKSYRIDVTLHFTKVNLTLHDYVSVGEGE